MEILYYWIDNFKSIKKSGYNFGGEYIFKYDEKLKKLKIEKNKNYIRNFFNTTDKNNIVNITGIIGKNGSGKTNLLSAIKGLLYDGGIFAKKVDEKYMYYERILVIKNEHTVKIFFYQGLINTIIYENDLIFEKEAKEDSYEITDLKKYNLEIIPYGNQNNLENVEKRNDIKLVKHTNVIKEITCIHYSNIFDGTINLNYMKDRESYYDISINNLMFKFDKKEESQLLLLGESYHMQSNEKRFDFGIIKHFKLKRLMAEIDFLSKDKIDRKNIPFNLPEKLYIKTDVYERSIDFDSFNMENKNNLLRYENKDIKKSKIEKRIYNILDDFEKKSSCENDGYIVRRHFFLRLIDAFFSDVDKFLSKETTEFLIQEINKISGYYESLNIVELLKCFKEIVLREKNEIKKLEDNKTQTSELEKFFFSEFEKLCDTYFKFIEFIEVFFTEKILKFHIEQVMRYTNKSGAQSARVEKIGFISIKIDRGGLNVVKEFLQLYFNLHTKEDFLLFQWRGISSGEYAMLEMFSRFYEVSKKQLTKNIMILIDEGETYFHPEWERRFIEILTNSWIKLFEKHQIQIIFTSNSPFLISDMPKSNIVFFNKENMDINDTFASNIHMLLKESFFMDSTIGEFAKKKIEQVVKVLNDENNDIEEDRKNEIRKTINIIGEPIIKKKLEQMYEKKFNNADKEKLKYELEKIKLEKSKFKEQIKKQDIKNVNYILDLLDERIEKLKKELGELD
ncbi:AAA family ATPase [Peptostreptococcaceae bacterium AGR-M142]